MIDHADNAKILEEIFTKILSLDLKLTTKRQPLIQEFIKTTVNGDNPKSYLAISANLKKDKVGILVYILTNKRLIKIEIDEKEVQSSSFSLNSIIGFEWKLIDEDKTTVEISFQSGSFGLGYSPKDQQVTDFFKKVDEARIEGVC